MQPEKNSPTFYRQVEARELSAVQHYPHLEALIVTIERSIAEGGGSGPGPPTTLNAEWLLVLTSAIGRVCEALPIGKFDVSQLWFLALVYLEIRGAEMRRYELSKEDAAYLAWFFSDESTDHHEDDVLTVREHMIIQLRERNMWAPRHFFPLLSTAA